MSRIVIDGRMLDWTGIGTYTRNLLDQLQDLDPHHEYLVLLTRADFDSWSPRQPNFHKILTNHTQPYGLSGQLGFAWQLYRLKPNLVHFVHFAAPILYQRRHVTTIHDLTLMQFNTAHGSLARRLQTTLKRWPARMIMWVAAKSARCIITPSNYVRDQLRQYYHLQPQRTVCTYEGTETAQLAPATPPPFKALPNNIHFLLYVGNYYPHKNIRRLLEGFAQLHRTDFQLVLAGRSADYRDNLVSQARELGVEPRVILLGYVTDEELAWLYQHAAAYVFPSLSEGFGLPGLEAMLYGLPVVASNATCLPEVYDHAAHYFDPNDPQDMARKIGEVLDDAALRQKLIAAGHERVKQFSWRRMAEQTLEVYEKALVSK